MIQRIQSIYLLIVAFLSGGLPFLAPLWKTKEGVGVFAQDLMGIFIGFLASGLLALISIGLYKKRNGQLALGRLNIVLNFVLLGFFVFWLLTMPGEMQISEKGIGIFIPIISIVFLALANKAIKKDENLVKSVDRLR